MVALVWSVEEGRPCWKDRNFFFFSSRIFFKWNIRNPSIHQHCYSGWRGVGAWLALSSGTPTSLPSFKALRQDLGSQTPPLWPSLSTANIYKWSSPAKIKCVFSVLSKLPSFTNDCLLESKAEQKERKQLIYTEVMLVLAFWLCLFC